eukprot:COSAG05_NODE_3388_length_2091_cov_1.236948_4_plen_92_part_00
MARSQQNSCRVRALCVFETVTVSHSLINVAILLASELPKDGRLGASGDSQQGFYDWRNIDVAAHRKQASELTLKILEATQGKVAPPPLSKL